jgi:hypothetical protein
LEWKQYVLEQEQIDRRRRRRPVLQLRDVYWDLPAPGAGDGGSAGENVYFCGRSEKVYGMREMCANLPQPGSYNGRKILLNYKNWKL